MLNPEKKSGYPTAAGVLIIIAACICIFLGILYMWVYIAGDYSYYYGHEHHSEYFFAGIFGLLGFAFGLTSGILTLKRRVLSLVIIGIALMMAGGIFSFAEPVIGIIFGIPVLLFGILGLIFTGMSHREFT